MTVNGIDISSFQGASNDDTIMDGCAFVGIRACYGALPWTDGLGHVHQPQDASYPVHEANARKHKAVVIAYCFGRHQDGARQADVLLAAAPHADLYALDMERDGGSPAMTASQASAFLARMASKTPKKCGLYHSESGFPSGLGEAFRWVAKWGATPPSGPWAFWQFQGSPLDRDRFNGTLAQLRSMAAVPAPAPASYSLVIDAHADIMLAAVTPTGLIAGWTHRAWGARASSAPCWAPVVKRGTHSGEATVVYVTRGALAGKWVRSISQGVSVISQGSPAPTPAQVPTPKPPIPLTPTFLPAVSTVYPWVAPVTTTVAGMAAIRVGTSGPAFLLVHGGPEATGQGHENDLLALGQRIADAGGQAWGVDYRSDTWEHARDDVTAACTAIAAIVGMQPAIVAHSFGGVGGSIAFFGGAGRAYAAINAVSSLAGVGQPYHATMPDPIALASQRPTAPVAVIRGALDTVDLADDKAGFLAAVHAAGHPGVNIEYPVDHDGPLGMDATAPALVALWGMA